MLTSGCFQLHFRFHLQPNLTCSNGPSMGETSDDDDLCRVETSGSIESSDHSSSINTVCTAQYPNSQFWYADKSGYHFCTCTEEVFEPHEKSKSTLHSTVHCVFFPFILDIKFVGRTSWGHTGGRSHRISHPPSFCGACLNFSREKDSAIPFPRRL